MQKDSQPHKPKIRLNTPVLPALTLIFFILVLLDRYQGWAILLVALGGTWLLATLWAFALARGLSIRREMRLGWAQVGDRLEERFTLVNRARLPALWVEVIGQTNMPDYWANQVRGVRRQAETRWQIRGICTRRGLYTLGPTTFETNDPFGIYTVTLHNPASTTLVVTPPVVPLPPIQVAPGGRAGEGVLRIKALDQDINSAGVREYVEGDSMRSIHWPTSARKNELFVREYERSPAGDWWIILDMDRQIQVGEGQNATQEHGIILAASLTDLGMRAGRSVGFAAHGDELAWHRPRLSDEYKWEILRSLALLEPGEVSLTELLELVRPSADRKASLIIITPAVDGKWLPSLLALRRLGVVPTVLLFDTQTFGTTGSPSGLADDLAALGITYQIIPRELLDRGERQKGEQVDWGWRDDAAGGVIPSLPRKEFSWRDIG
jgi:uncharacterized protein (DUF58 family)